MRRARALAALAAGILAATCGDGIVEGGPDALTRAEVLSLAAQIGLESLAFAQDQDGGAQQQARVGHPREPETLSVTYDLRRPCLRGGWVDSHGTILVTTDVDPDRTTVDVVATDAHQACVFQAEQTLVTLTGDPDVTTEVHLATLEREPEGLQWVSVMGAVLWETDDDRSGRCEIDVLVELDPATDTQTTRGRFCDHEFDVTVTGG